MGMYNLKNAKLISFQRRNLTFIAKKGDYYEHSGSGDLLNIKVYEVPRKRRSHGPSYVIITDPKATSTLVPDGMLNVRLLQSTKTGNRMDRDAQVPKNDL